MLQQICQNNVSVIHPLKVDSNRKLVSFKAVPDSFEVGINTVFGEVSEEVLSLIGRNFDGQKEVGKGFTSSIFRFKDLIIKSPKLDNIDEFFKEFALGQNIKEYYALKEIEKINPDIATRAHGVVERKGLFYLIEDVVQGAHPDKRSLNPSHLNDLLSKFAQLDKNGIVNCDLQSGNIFLTNDQKTKLIDFGSFMFLDNHGQILSSDSIYPPFFKPNGQIYPEINLSNKLKFTRTFFAPSLYDIKNYADNPYLNVASNVSNFELRTLYKHLRDGNEQNPLEFVREYLKAKGQSYHRQMSEFLKTLNIDDVVLDSDSPPRAYRLKTVLKKSIDYEQTAQQVLSSPSEGVIKTELAKIQVKTFLNPDDLGSSIPNAKKLQSAYNQLISILEQNIVNSDGSEKEYYRATLTAITERFKNIEFEPNQVDIPDDENLIKCVFKEVKKVASSNESVINTVKQSNRKLYLLLIPVIGVLGLAGAFIYKKGKAKKAEVKVDDVKSVVKVHTPISMETKPIQKVQNNALANNSTNIFSDFMS